MPQIAEEMWRSFQELYQRHIEMSKGNRYKVIVLHDNHEWFSILQKALVEHDVEVEQWIGDEVDVDLTKEPPKNAVFYNRCSPSSYIRGHRASLDQARGIVQWLRSHNRVVINGETAINVEDSKAYQYVIAQKSGLNVPKTIFTSNPTSELIAENFGTDAAFMIKPNRGELGLDVRKYNNVFEFENDTKPLQSQTGLYVIQRFLPLTQGLYRSEFVGKKYMYTSIARTPCDGFDSCFCPCKLPKERFKIITNSEQSFIKSCTNFFKATDIDNGAIEYIYDENGVPYVIDINCTTGYNTAAEKEANSKQGYVELAKYIYRRVEQLRRKLPIPVHDTSVSSSSNTWPWM